MVAGQARNLILDETTTGLPNKREVKQQPLLALDTEGEASELSELALDLYRIVGRYPRSIRLSYLSAEQKPAQDMP